jgi:tripartite motif-containing protein 71
MCRLLTGRAFRVLGVLLVAVLVGYGPWPGGDAPFAGTADSASAMKYVAKIGVPLQDTQLDHPSAVASDGTYLYIADAGDARIVKIRLSDMSFVDAYSGSAGQWFDPEAGMGGLAVDGGYLYVSDYSRIVRLSTALDGSGWKTYGTFGTGVGQFDYLGELSVDGGFVYAADRDNHRVVRLGTALDGSGWAAYGSQGAGPGQFASLTGLTVAAGWVFVADPGNHRIERFATTLDGMGWTALVSGPGHSFGPVEGLAFGAGGLFAGLGTAVARMNPSLDGSGWTTFGSSGTGAGQFRYASALARAGAMVYVADGSLARVVQLPASLDGSSWITYGRLAYSDKNQFGAASGLASDGTYIYVADARTCRIVKLKASNLAWVKAYGSCAAIDNFRPGDLVVAGGYLFATAYDHVVRLSTALDGSGWKTYGGFGTGVGQFKGASGIATASGFLYVADAYNDRVVRLSTALNGSGWKTYGTSGSGTGQFKSPHGIAVSAGYAYVADSSNDRIVRLSTKLNGSGWKAYGSQGSGTGKFSGPSAIAVRGSSLFVADTYNARIVKLKAPSLAWIATAGSRGSGNAKFNEPIGIEVRDGYLYIGDTGWWPGMNHRVVKWTTGG